MQAPQRAVPSPQRQVIVHRALGRQVLGQSAPLAAGCQNVEDPVQDLAHDHRPLAAAALGRRDQGLHQRPLGVGEVAWVTQPVTRVRLPLLGRPHRASPPAMPERNAQVAQRSPLPSGQALSSTLVVQAAWQSA